MYIVMNRAAAMPSHCWGSYRKIAVVEIDQKATAENIEPKMISNRARHLVRIVRIWDRQHDGKTKRCASHKAYVAACTMAESLNNAAPYERQELIMTFGGSA